jgi:predicted ArsR family transcriptional regulator
MIGMDVPTAPADVLAQPTRARLFALLGELGRPAGTDELARTLGLHVNCVRTHLEHLREAGLVERERERRARGRPRDTWSIRPDANPGGGPPSGYVDLGRWLTRALSRRKTRARDVEATGREIGRELAGDGDTGSAESQLYGRLVAMGFQPVRRRDSHRNLTYELVNCPYRDAVREDQAVVCGLHRGLTRGLLDTLSPETELTGFVPKDPYAAGCLIQLRGPLAEEGATSAREPAPERQERQREHGDRAAQRDRAS